MLQKNTTIWCDMDGVVAVYDVNGFRGNNPPFLRPKQHYFRNCIPDEKMIKALKLLHDIYHINIKIISNVATELKQEHISDKEKWLRKYMSFIDTTQDYYGIVIPKSQYVEKITNRKLCKTDILISDFNQDLLPWTQNGGTGIKYANGINNPHSYDGLHIPETYTTTQIVNHLIDIINNLSQY